MREAGWARADTLIRRKFGTVPFGDQVLFAVVQGDSLAERRLRAQAPEMAGKKGRRTSGLAVETGWLLANSDRAHEIDPRCWRVVFRSKAGTVFKHAARCREPA